MAIEGSSSIAQVRAVSPTGDPWQLTPDPLTGSPEVKRVMQHGYGSRNSHLDTVNQSMKNRLANIVNGQGTQVSFHMPKDPALRCQTIYDSLRDKGYIIYPGKLTIADTFWIGCIGRLGKTEIEGPIAAIEAALCSPSAPMGPIKLIA